MNEEEKLDSFLPDEQTLQSIKRQLINAGIDSNLIPGDWLRAISAAFAKQVSTSAEGHNYISRLLNLRWQQGRNTKEYVLLNEHGKEIEEIDHEHVSLFTGCVIKGSPVHPSHIRVRDRTGYHCDDCGVKSHCVTEVLNYRKDSIESLCNTCLKFSEEPRQQIQYKQGMCDACDDMSCPHNPKLDEHRLENEACQGHHSAFGKI